MKEHNILPYDGHAVLIGVVENLQVYRVRFGETKAASSEPDLGARIAEERSTNPDLQAHESVAR